MNYLKTRHTLRMLTAVAVSLALGLSPLAQAQDIQLNGSLNGGSRLRRYDNKYEQQERVAFANKNSTVEVDIPSEYLVYKNGKMDIQASLNQWLRASDQKDGTVDGFLPGKYKFDGDKYDYFFPVTIKDPTSGSTGQTGQKYMVAMKFLVLKGKDQDAKLIMDKKAPLVPITGAKTQQKAATSSALDNYKVTNASVLCPQSDPIDKLQSHLSQTLAKLGNKIERNEADNVSFMNKMETTFKKSCGMSLDTFETYAQQKAKDSNIPFATLMAVMSHESEGGKCHVLQSEKDNTQSVGLFQINTESSKIPRCTANQSRRIFGQSIEKLKSDSSLRCLENPVVNLEESIRILKEKEAILSQPLKDKDSGKIITQGFDMKKMSEDDRLRLILSAYNGGEGWAMIAKEDLEDFNKKQGSHLDPNKWEDLRLFYFRRILTGNEQKMLFGSNKSDARSWDNMIINVAYVESIMGRGVAGQKYVAMTNVWETQLAKDK